MAAAIYPGIFDPITNGHLDVIRRASNLFESIEVVVGYNPAKKTLFDVSHRVILIKENITDLNNVKVTFFKGLTVEYLKRHSVKVVIRGLRALSDFEYEFQMAMMNKKMYTKCETIYLMPNENYTYLSSSFVKEIASLDGDIDQFVPENVKLALREKFSNNKTTL